MVKSSSSSSSLNNSSTKRARVELFDLKLFITRPSLFYKARVQKSKLALQPKSSSSSSLKVIKNKPIVKSSNKQTKPTKSKVTYNYQKLKSTGTSSSSSSTNNNSITTSSSSSSSTTTNNNIIYLNNSTYNNYGTAYFSGSSAVLTTDSTDRIGSIYTKDLMDIEKSFNIEFSYTLETNGTDGVALIIHNNQSTQSPFEFYRLLEGGLLEYNTLSDGGILAIEFKTILNDDIKQPNTNRITIKSSVESSSGESKINSLSNTVHVYDFTTNIKYNNTNNVKVSYDSNNSQLSLSLNNNLVLNNINIPKLLNKGFIGFVAATGYCIQRQQINNCKIQF